MQKAYLFNETQYVRYDIPTNKVDKGPVVTKDNWKGFPSWSKIDAALNLGNGKIYFFNGDKYIRFDILMDKVDQGELLIKNNWHGYPASWTKIDAAVNWGNGKAYFFSGDKYIRYDILLDQVDQGEQPIKTYWHGFPSDWNHVDAALNWGDGKVYLFHGSQYVVYDVATDKVDSEKRSIQTYWNGFPTGWGKLDAAIIIDLNAEHMGASIEKKIKDKTVGFAYCIYEDKRMVKSGYGGWRAKPIDVVGGLPFSINTQLGIGSITKSLTTMALIKSLDAHGLSVDTMIGDYLPKAWTPQGDNISSIKFSELLTHYSGIRAEGDSYDSLRTIVQDGITLADKMTGVYRNANFTLMRVLIPVINGTVLSLLNELGNDQKVADAYKLYMQKSVFEPSGVRNADCKLNSTEFALLYGPPSDPSGGFTYSNQDDSTLIAGAGGWKLSTLELGKVIHTFFTTERILPNLLKTEMLDRQLGCYDKDGTVTAAHGGAWGETKGYRNCYYIFKDNVQCVIMTNSAGSDPETAVKNAHSETYP